MIFFFVISLLRKHGSPCLLRNFLAYIFSGLLITMQFVKRLGFVEKLCPRTRTFCVPRGNKGFGNWPKKTDSPRELYRDQLKVSDEKMLLVTEKIEKAYLVPNLFCLPERRNSSQFFKLQGVHAYYIFPLWSFNDITPHKHPMQATSSPMQRIRKCLLRIPTISKNSLKIERLQIERRCQKSAWIPDCSRKIWRCSRLLALPYKIQNKPWIGLLLANHSEVIFSVIL